jgi:hypothetical protein
MKQVLRTLCMVAYFLLATGTMASDKAAIKKNVDEMVAAIDNGKTATSYAADAYTPYAFIMEPNGRLVVHPYLAGEYLHEKAAPVYKALQKATTDGIWVTYFWKGAQKETYVRRTKNNLTIGSGY